MHHFVKGLVMGGRPRPGRGGPGRPPQGRTTEAQAMGHMGTHPGRLVGGRGRCGGGVARPRPNDHIDF